MATYSEVEVAVTDKLNQEGWEIKRADVAEIMKALSEVAADYVAKGEPFTIRGIVKIAVKLKPKTPKRTMEMFGEVREVAAKPASITFARPVMLKQMKDALPSVQKMASRSARTTKPASVEPQAKATAKPAARRAGAKSKPDPTKAARKRR
jgi:nucleoid DNA-binding protein